MDSHLISEFRCIVGDAGLVTAAEQRRTYECDGLTLFRVVPELVLLPASGEEMQAVVKICHRERIPFVARGAGTGLSGGALPVKGGVVIGVSRMNRILEVDVPNARVVVEAGVTNSAITAAVSAHGYFLRSRSFLAGGLHCSRQRGREFGRRALLQIRRDHYLYSRARRSFSPMDHSSIWAAKRWIVPAYDLVGSFVGSEGTFGIVTRITLRSSRNRNASRR